MAICPGLEWTNIKPPACQDAWNLFLSYPMLLSTTKQVDLSGNAQPTACFTKLRQSRPCSLGLGFNDHGWPWLVCLNLITDLHVASYPWFWATQHYLGVHITVCVNTLYYSLYHSLFVLNSSKQFGMLVTSMLDLWAFWSTSPPSRPSAYSWPKDWRPGMTNHFKRITTEWYGSAAGGLSMQHAQSS